MRSTLTAERLRELLNYDPDTGVFRCKVQRGNLVARRVAGYTDNHDGRRRVSIDGRKYLASRLAWLYMTGAWPTGLIDHIDGDVTNDRIANLRDTTPAENSQNRAQANRGSRVELLGTHWHSRDKKYVARIYVDSKECHLGYFTTAEEAHAVYVDAKLMLHHGAVAARFGGQS